MIKNRDALICLLGTESDAALGRRFSCNSVTVYRLRVMRGIPRYGRGKNQPRKPIPEFIALLGKVADKEIAKKYGKSVSAITRSRLRRGIPPVGRREEAQLRDTYAQNLNGAICEVLCDGGRIDVLTNDCIYEMKLKLDISALHSAFSQLLIYSHFYPSRKLKIVTRKIAIDTEILEILKEYGIEVEVFL